jgi:hypothetical protein
MTPRQQFLELPRRQQADILEKHRDINVFYDWHECAIDDFKNDMGRIGIRVGEVYFSGFCSQGDGACFEGVVTNWELFLKSLGYTCAALISHAHNAFRFVSEHRGRYSHHKSVIYESDLPMPDNEHEYDFCNRFNRDPAGSLHEAVWYALLSEHNSDSLEKEFKKCFEGEMKRLYKELNDEHDHLTSDAAVLDTLVNNDMLIEILEGETA